MGQDKLLEEAPHPGVLAVTLAVVLGTFLSVLNQSILNVALPQLMVLFGVDTNEIQWVLTAFLLVSGAIIPITSYLGNRFGYRRVYIWSVGAFTVGSFLCGLAWNNGSLIFFRIIQGIGGGLVAPVAMALMFRFVPKEKMGMAMGIFGLSIAAAPSVGPTLGGFLVEHYSWRLLFMINVPLGIISMLLSEILLPETPIKKPESFDLWGLVLSSGAAVLFLYALSEGPKLGWTSYPIVMMFLTAFFMMAVMVVVEWHHPDPMLDLRVFKFGQYNLSLVLSSLLNVALLGPMLLLPIYLQNIRGYSAMDTGFLLMPQAIAMGLMMPVAGKLFDVVGVRPLLAVGLPLIVFPTYQLHALGVDTPEAWIQWYLIIRGLGMGLTFMPITTAGMNVIPPHLQGGASAMNTLIRSIAGSFGIAVTTALLNNRVFLHQHRMAEGLDAFSASWATMQGAASGILAQVGDLSLAGMTALSLMGSQVVMQATAWAVGDVFWVYGIALALVIPGVMLFRDGKAKGKAPTADEAA